MNGTASPGVATPYSREDHIHPSDSSIPVPASATPLIESGAGGVGTSVKFAREDHVHPALSTATRTRLTASQTYYVRSDGNDANTGLVNNAGGAFLTIQRAVNFVANNIDLAGCNVAIQIGTTGTWTEAVIVQGPFVGGGPYVFVNISGPGSANLNWTTPGGNGFPITASSGAVIVVSNVRFLNNNCHVMSQFGGLLCIGVGVDFGPTGGYHIFANSGGLISGHLMTSGYTISGGGLSHMEVESAGMIQIAGVTVALVGTPNFTQAFANAQRGGFIGYNSNTFSGGATGQRWAASGNAVLFCNNASPNTYFPGNANGAVSLGGQCF